MPHRICGIPILGAISVAFCAAHFSTTVMNRSGLTAEEKTKSLLKLFKKKAPQQEGGMQFISPEEGNAILQAEKNATKKRERPTKNTKDQEEEDLHPDWKKGRKDTREISTVLPLGEFAKNKGIRVKGPVITPMMVEFFHDYLEKHPTIKKIAVIGFNSGYTTETFLTARNDITVVAFDPLHYPYVGICMNQITERYHNRFMLMGGIVKETIELLSSFLGSKRFDMIYIDSGSYPTTARDDLSASRYLAHSKTIVFMENVKPYSKTGVNAFEGWDSFVQSGELRELDEPHTWEELNRCLCEGIFVAGDDKTPLRPGEMSRVRRFWESDPSAVLWKYGNELQTADPEKAMEIWDTMTQNGIQQDRTAFNMYVAALQKGTDRKYQQEIERVKKLKFD